MNERSPDYRPWELATDRTRGNAFSAGIAALCLLYFGYFGIAKPVGTDLFSFGNLIFYYCLRIGGVAMGMIAAASLLGAPVVLICDAVVSVLLGGLFIASAGMMLADGGGGLNPFLMIVFGFMFISAGLRNGRAFMAFHRAGAASDAAGPIRVQNPAPQHGGFEHYADDQTTAEPPSQAPADRSASLAGQLLRHTRDQADASRPIASPATAVPQAAAPRRSDEISQAARSTTMGHAPPDARPVPSATLDGRPAETPAAPPVPVRPAQPDQPPPAAPEEGFLAAFAPPKNDDGST